MQNSPASDDDRSEGAPGGEVAHAEPERPADAEPPPELAELRERNEQLEGRYKRSLADLDNYRKRSVREVEHRVKESREAFLLDWFEAVDSVERALRLASPEDPLYQGLLGVLGQMESILQRQGVRRVGEPGELFDPGRHEAVGIVESEEAPDRTVTEVARSGFALGDRVLRPAEVVVSRGGGGEG